MPDLNLSAAFTPEQWENIVNNADETMVPDILAVTIIGGIFSILFVAMRLASRRLLSKYFKLDWSDWLCIAALVFTLALVLTVAVGIKFGAGHHIVKVPDLRSLYIIFLMANGFHPAAMCALKLSILVLYHGIFASRPFRWVCWAVGIFTILWTAASIVAGIALCVPIEKLWDPTIIGGVCIPLAPIGLAITSSHIATDFIILFMPVPLVLKLKTTRKKKILIISTLVVGGAACVVSIARLPVWLNNESTLDIGWEQIPSAMLAIAELTVGILAVCFPVYRPLLRFVTGKGKNAFGSDGTGYTGSNRRPGVHPSSPQVHGTVDTEVSTVRSMAPLGRRIKATDEIELITHRNRGDGWAPVPDGDTSADGFLHPSAPNFARRMNEGTGKQ